MRTKSHSPAFHPLHSWTPYFVLAVTLMLTAVTAYYVGGVARAKDQLKFENSVRRTEGLIRNRLETYLALLRAGAAYISTSEEVSREEFRSYVDRLELQTRYPGIQGIGFTVRAKPEEVDALGEKMRRQGAADFHLWPENERSEFHSIIYLEPLDRRNMAAIGYDMFTEPVRRAAMEQARDTGLPAASGPVTLVQEIDEQKQAGFLVYVPVYRDGLAPESVAERRENLAGFVYSPLRADDLLDGILGRIGNPDVSFKVFDAQELTPASLLHRSNRDAENSSFQPRFTAVSTIDVAGRNWSLSFTSRPEFEAELEGGRVRLIVIAGILISLALFLITRAQSKARAEVERSAHDLRTSTEALRESEERFNAFMDNSPAIAFMKDEEGRYVYVSKPFRSQYNMEPAGCLGKTDFDLWPEEVSRKLREHDLAVLSSGQTSEMIEEVPPVDGAIKSWLAFKFPIKDSSGRVFLAGIAVDITGRKHMEEELRKSEERFQLVTRATNDAVWDWDFSTGQLWWNGNIQTLFGYSADQIGTDCVWWEERIHPDDRGQISAGLVAAIDQGKHVWGSEYRFRRANGSYAFVYDRGFVAHDAAGRPVRMTGSMMDITRRREAELEICKANQRAIKEYKQLLERLATLAQALGTARELETVYRALCDFSLVSAPCTALFISIYHWNREEREMVYFWKDGKEVFPSELPLLPVGGGPAGQATKTGEIVVCNDYLDAFQEGPQFWVGPEEPQLPRRALIAPMSIMGRVIGTVEIQNSTGDIYTVEHTAAMRMAANMAASAIENVRLIELEREKEEQSRQSQKMEAIGQLAGGVAHDFNNLLTAITGYSDLSIRRLVHGDPIRRNLEEIKKASDRAASLTRQLLAFSRRQVLQPKILNLNGVISDTYQMLGRLIGADIEVGLFLKPELWRIKADPGQIDQVLMNLAVNARDAMPDGGKLTIRTANVEMDPEIARKYVSVQAGPHVLLTVSDTGCGMDEETKQHIFEPFFTTKSVGNGTGLGLSTVYGIIKQSGGYISVESEVGAGTTFSIYLPRASEAVADEDTSGRVADLPGGDETVLLAEDEEVVRMMTARILEESGYTVITAANGQEALRICSEHQRPIDLMLTDVVMPELGGSRLAARAVEMRPGMKVLYTSGYTDDAIVHHGVLEPGTLFLEKPFAPDQLIRKVREVLDLLAAECTG